MCGKLKHKSRSRKTYKHRMAAAHHVLNHYSVGRAHAKKKKYSCLLALVKAMKRRHSAAVRESKSAPIES